MDNFTNLHLHTLYSIGDSVIKIEELVNKLVEYGQTACAITDHSTTAGFFDFKNACLQHGIKPIFGNELYMNQSYESPDRAKEHFVCLAMNDEGVKNINRLQNKGVEHFYYKPTVAYESFEEYTYGLFGTSACSQGIIARLILDDKIDTAWDWADKFMVLFDENFALELQFHPQYSDQKEINKGLLRIHELSGIPLTVSTDAHVIDSSYFPVRKAITAIGYKTSYKSGYDTLYSNVIGNTDLVLQFAEESNFDLKVARQAIDFTKKIADKCNADLCGTDRKVPEFNKHEELWGLMDEVLGENLNE